MSTKDEEYASKNILSEEEAAQKIKVLKQQRKRIGLCAGSFDLMHPGHINHLNSAKKKVDVLLVSIASDKYNKTTRKAKGRPIFNQRLRAFSVSQLKVVDYVIMEENHDKLLQTIKPDYYIKGIDYNEKLIKVRELVKQQGGKLYFTPTEKLSTTELIKYIQEEVREK